MRHRIVTDQGGKLHVSSVVLTLDEAAEQLENEEFMHRMTGWDVRRYGATLRAQKSTVVRWIWIRSREATEDTL